MPTDRQFRLARHWSNYELRKFAPLMTGDIVNVSAGEDVDKQGGKYADYFPAKKSYSLTNHQAGSYRGFQGRQNEYLIDLTAELPSELQGRFDVAFNHTTMEHIFEVRKAFANLCAMTKDVVIVVVPFAQVQHESSDFGDFWRFTPTCIRHLFKENGLETVYESANNSFNAAVYVFAIGSRHPDRWRGKLPAHAPIHQAANWVGKSFVKAALQKLGVAGKKSKPSME
jgi:hypothetical protein